MRLKSKDAFPARAGGRTGPLHGLRWGVYVSVLLLLGGLGGERLEAQSIRNVSSIASGNWSLNATWAGGVVPNNSYGGSGVADDILYNVTIGAPTSVTLNMAAMIEDFSLLGTLSGSGSTLTARGAANLAGTILSTGSSLSLTLQGTATSSANFAVAGGAVTVNRSSATSPMQFTGGRLELSGGALNFNDGSYVVGSDVEIAISNGRQMRFDGQAGSTMNFTTQNVSFLSSGRSNHLLLQQFSTLSWNGPSLLLGNGQITLGGNGDGSVLNLPATSIGATSTNAQVNIESFSSQVYGANNPLVATGGGILNFTNQNTVNATNSFTLRSDGSMTVSGTGSEMNILRFFNIDIQKGISASNGGDLIFELTASGTSPSTSGQITIAGDIAASSGGLIEIRGGGVNYRPHSFSNLVSASGTNSRVEVTRFDNLTLSGTNPWSAQAGGAIWVETTTTGRSTSILNLDVPISLGFGSSFLVGQGGRGFNQVNVSSRAMPALNNSTGTIMLSGTGTGVNASNAVLSLPAGNVAATSSTATTTLQLFRSLTFGSANPLLATNGGKLNLTGDSTAGSEFRLLPTASLTVNGTGSLATWTGFNRYFSDIPLLASSGGRMNFTGLGTTSEGAAISQFNQSLTALANSQINFSNLGGATFQKTILASGTGAVITMGSGGSNNVFGGGLLFNDNVIAEGGGSISGRSTRPGSTGSLNVTPFTFNGNLLSANGSNSQISFVGFGNPAFGPSQTVSALGGGSIRFATSVEAPSVNASTFSLNSTLNLNAGSSLSIGAPYSTSGPSSTGFRTITVGTQAMPSFNLVNGGAIALYGSNDSDATRSQLILAPGQLGAIHANSNITIGNFPELVFSSANPFAASAGGDIALIGADLGPARLVLDSTSSIDVTGQGSTFVSSVFANTEVRGSVTATNRGLVQFNGGNVTLDADLLVDGNLSTIAVDNAQRVDVLNNTFRILNDGILRLDGTNTVNSTLNLTGDTVVDGGGILRIQQFGTISLPGSLEATNASAIQMTGIGSAGSVLTIPGDLIARQASVVTVSGFPEVILDPAATILSTGTGSQVNIDNVESLILRLGQVEVSAGGSLRLDGTNTQTSTLDVQQALNVSGNGSVTLQQFGTMRIGAPVNLTGGSSMSIRGLQSASQSADLHFTTAGRITAADGSLFRINNVQSVSGSSIAYPLTITSDTGLITFESIGTGGIFEMASGQASLDIQTDIELVGQNGILRVQGGSPLNLNGNDLRVYGLTNQIELPLISTGHTASNGNVRAFDSGNILLTTSNTLNNVGLFWDEDSSITVTQYLDFGSPVLVPTRENEGTMILNSATVQLDGADGWEFRGGGTILMNRNATTSSLIGMKSAPVDPVSGLPTAAQNSWVNFDQHIISTDGARLVDLAANRAAGILESRSGTLTVNGTRLAGGQFLNEGTLWASGTGKISIGAADGYGVLQNDGLILSTSGDIQPITLPSVVNQGNSGVTRAQGAGVVWEFREGDGAATTGGRLEALDGAIIRLRGRDFRNIDLFSSNGGYFTGDASPDGVPGYTILSNATLTGGLIWLSGSERLVLEEAPGAAPALRINGGEFHFYNLSGSGGIVVTNPTADSLGTILLESGAFRGAHNQSAVDARFVGTGGLLEIWNPVLGSTRQDLNFSGDVSLSGSVTTQFFVDSIATYAQLRGGLAGAAMAPSQLGGNLALDVRQTYNPYINGLGAGMVIFQDLNGFTGEFSNAPDGGTITVSGLPGISANGTWTFRVEHTGTEVILRNPDVPRVYLDLTGNTSGFGDWAAGAPVWRASGGAAIWAYDSQGAGYTYAWDHLGGGVSADTVMVASSQSAPSTVTVSGTVDMGSTDLIVEGTGPALTLAGGTLAFAGGAIQVDEPGQSLQTTSAVTGSLRKSGAGTWTSQGALVGTDVSVVGGQLRLQGTTSAATVIRLDDSSVRLTLDYTGTRTIGDLDTVAGSLVEAGAGREAVLILNLINGANATISGTIADGGGSTAVTVSGGGTATFGAAGNSYSGQTLVDAGNLYAAVASALSPNSVLQISQPGWVEALGDQTVAGLLGAGTYTGETLLAVNQSFDGEFSGSVQGGTGLTKSGSGVLTLSGTNSYLGATVILGGTLELGGGGASGSIGSADVLNQSLLRFNRSDTFSFANLISGTGSVEQSGSGTTILTANNSYEGGTVISGGVLQVGQGGTSGTTGTGDILNNSLLVFNRSDDFSLEARISGSGSLVQAGPGQLTLGGNNTYAGTTTVEGGELVVGASHTGGSSYVIGEGARLLRSPDATITNSAGPGPALTVKGGGTFSYASVWNTQGRSVDFQSNAILSLAEFGTASDADNIGLATFQLAGGSFSTASITRRTALDSAGNTVAAGDMWFDLTEDPGGSGPLGGTGTTLRGDQLVLRGGQLAIGAASVTQFTFHFPDSVRDLHPGTYILFDTDQQISGSVATNSSGQPEYFVFDTYRVYLSLENSGQDLAVNLVRPINYQLIYEDQTVGGETRLADTQGQTSSLPNSPSDASDTAFETVYYGSINREAYVSVYGVLPGGDASLWYGQATGTGDYPLRLLSRENPTDLNILPDSAQSSDTINRYRALDILNPDGSVAQAGATISAYQPVSGGSFATVISDASGSEFYVGMPMVGGGVTGSGIYPRSGLSPSGESWGTIYATPPGITGVTQTLLLNDAGQPLNLARMSTGENAWVVAGRLVAMESSMVVGFVAGQRVGGFNAAGAYSPGIALASDGRVVFRGDGNYAGPGASPGFTEAFDRGSIFRSAAPEGDPDAVEVVLRGAAFGLNDAQAALQRYTYENTAIAGGGTTGLAIAGIGQSISTNALGQVAATVRMFNEPGNMGNTASHGAVVFVSQAGIPTVVSENISLSNDQVVLTLAGSAATTGRLFFTGTVAGGRSIFAWDEGSPSAPAALFLPGETLTVGLGDSYLPDIRLTLTEDPASGRFFGAWQATPTGDLAVELWGSWVPDNNPSAESREFHGVVLWDWSESLGGYRMTKIMMEGDTVDNTDGTLATLDWFRLPSDWVPTNGEEGRPTWLNDGNKITFYGGLHYFTVDESTGNLVMVEEEGVFAPFQADDAGAPIPEPRTWLLVALALLSVFVFRRIPPAKKPHHIL